MLRLFKQFYPIRNIFFVFGEGILIFISVITISVLIQNININNLNALLYLKAFLITLICQVCLYYNEMYDVKIVDDYHTLLGNLARALGSASIILSGVHFVLGDAIISNKTFIYSLILISILVISWRFLYNIILDHGVFKKKIAVVGQSELIETILEEISDKRDSGYQIIYICPNGDLPYPQLEQKLTTKSIGENYGKLNELILSLGIRLLVADTVNTEKSMNLENELLECRISGVNIMDGYSFYEMAAGKLDVKRIKQSWLIYSEGFQTSPHHRFVKRIIDYALSLTLGVLVLPVVLLTALFIKIDSPGPVFFSQERMGKGRVNYKMFKFRSMTENAEKKSGPAWSGENDSRVTFVGKYIRNFRIDELPQLWNVLKGDMSFVGPRPEREFFVNQLEKVIPHYGIRFAVKPGITGWAQVNYGYGATVEDAVEKLNYDLYYIKNASFAMDIYIVFRTTKTVILGVESGNI